MKTYIVEYYHRNCGTLSMKADTVEEVRKIAQALATYGHTLKCVKVQVWKPFGTGNGWELTDWYIDKSF